MTGSRYTRKGHPTRKRPLSSKRETIQQQRKKGKIAVLDILKENPKTSCRKIQMETGVSKSTVNRLANGETTIDAKAGRKPYFTSDEEEELEQWIFEMSDHGFGVETDDVIKKANAMLQKKTNTGKHVSEGWYAGFRDRHPRIVKRIASHLSQLRENSENPTTIATFFDTLNTIITENKLLPTQVYNCDESGLIKNLSGHFTLARKGTHKVQITVPNDRRTTTIHACINAAGESLPHFVIHKAKSINKDYFKGIADGQLVSFSE